MSDVRHFVALLLSRFSEEAMAGIEEAVRERKLKHYSSTEEMVEFITQVREQWWFE